MIVKRGSQYCVARESNGAIIKCFPTRQQALDMLAAIEISKRKRLSEQFGSVEEVLEYHDYEERVD